jgi:DNA topoisomerase-1
MAFIYMAPRYSASVQRLMRKLGLRLTEARELTVRRRRRGRGFEYVTGDGRPLRNARVLSRFSRLAVPPAYSEVRLAADERAHLQAVGRDAAGRLQYRYHPEWESVRNSRKARRLARLASALPAIRRHVGTCLAAKAPSRTFALAAVIELVARTAIRAGSRRYVSAHGTRGATTLLKSHVRVKGATVTLGFNGKLGKPVNVAVRGPRLASAIRALRKIPGKALFQYRDDGGAVRTVSRSDVNAYLKDIAGMPISLKDFRTLAATDIALAELSAVERGTSARRRKTQVRNAMAAAAEVLANTPAICRKSYVHSVVVEAFEGGKLAGGRSRSREKRQRQLRSLLREAAP